MRDDLTGLRRHLADLADGRGLALDAEGLWRAATLFSMTVAEGLAADDDPAVVFSGAVSRADGIGATLDWSRFCPSPVARAGGRLILEAITRYLADGVPLERTLGLAPDRGQTARHGVRLESRDRLLRRIAELPIYQGKTARQVARQMGKDFAAYLETHDPDRAGRPQGQPAGDFWLLAKMRKTDENPDGLAVVMPGVDRLEQIIDA